MPLCFASPVVAGLLSPPGAAPQPAAEFPAAEDAHSLQGVGAGAHHRYRYPLSFPQLSGGSGRVAVGMWGTWWHPVGTHGLQKCNEIVCFAVSSLLLCLYGNYSVNVLLRVVTLPAFSSSSFLLQSTRRVS